MALRDTKPSRIPQAPLQLDEARISLIAWQVLRVALIKGEGVIAADEWERRVCLELGPLNAFAREIVGHQVRRVVEKIIADTGLPSRIRRTDAAA